MKKVLFTASTASHILNFHLPYLQRFQEAGWLVHVACGGQMAEIPYTDRLTALPLKKSMYAAENFRAAAMLREQMQAEKYELICTHTSLAAFFTRLAVQGMKNRPVVVNMVHGYLFDEKTSWLKRNILLAAERFTATVTDLVLTMNQYDYETAVKYRLGKKIAPIPGVGVDFSQLERLSPESRTAFRERVGIPDDAFVLIYAAEFSRRKSQPVLIRGMAQLPERFMLILAGNGELLPACQTLTERLGVTNRVLFPGHVSLVGQWYSMADAAVSASRSEGLPFNIMEAMHAGLPIIASDVKGHRDLIVHEETGLLYPYGDSDACAKQVLRLAESVKLRQNLASNAQTAVEKYDIARVLPKVWAEYEAAVPRRFRERSLIF